MGSSNADGSTSNDKKKTVPVKVNRDHDIVEILKAVILVIQICVVMCI
jgi:hypothetical protein